MLFIGTYTHNAENCIAHQPEKAKVLRDTILQAKDKGVTVTAVYTNSTCHVMYLYVQTDAVDKLAQAFNPIIEWGTFRWLPVRQSWPPPKA